MVDAALSLRETSNALNVDCVVSAAFGRAAMDDAKRLAGRFAEPARAKIAHQERLSRTVPGLTRP